MLDPKSKTRFRRQLLKWFDANQRDLPWRKKKTPYRIWVSEIMLQQTQVATVIDYYRRFMKRFPNVKSLASAEQEDVLKLWEGLGYYRRARQMHAAAQVVVEQFSGQFPTDFDSVLALPGIGRYTAGAILSISQDQKLPILEGNTIRVFARLLAMRDDPRTTANQKELWAFSESLLPAKRAGDFNQSLMELGSEICKPRSPLCQQCPIASHCPTFANGWHESIPASGKKVKYEDLKEAVVLVGKPSIDHANPKFLIRKCVKGERWAGLWDFPRFSVSDSKSNRSVQENLALELKQLTGFAGEIESTDVTIKHAVTRFRIKLSCYCLTSRTGRLKSNKMESFKWASLPELAKLPMSVTGRKIADRLPLDG
jgi:A/G-specific adenine glycosylase